MMYKFINVYLTVRLVKVAVIFMCLKRVNCYNIDTLNSDIYSTNRPGSYFGYSVELLKTPDGQRLLMVGAPKDNFTSNDSARFRIQSPGAVYRCPVTFPGNWQHCRQMDVPSDRYLERLNSSYTYPNQKGLLGASMSVNKYFPRNNYLFVVCAPKWKQTRYELSGRVFPIGRCYLSSDGQTFTQSFPGVNPKIKNIDPNTRRIKGGASEGGTSVSFTPDVVLLGCPGLLQWTGGFMKYHTDNYKETKFLHESEKDLTNSHYTGYAVAYIKDGKGNGRIVAGSPRYFYKDGHKSRIFIYGDDGELKATSEGSQFGSYFGSSLCVVDVNGDGIEDILVGAPLFFDEHVDEGRVYIFLGGSWGNWAKSLTELTGDNKENARFGLAIGSLGDINLDNYNDVAIGAPYEDNLAGAVYIYHGAQNGLINPYSQRIGGNDVKPGIQAFGWYISSNLDLDSNEYPDFAVGAYMSDDVVVLRTRPIVDLTGRLDLDPNVISLNTSTQTNPPPFENNPCMKISLCFAYKGKSVPNEIRIDYWIRADTAKTAQGEKSRIHLYRYIPGSSSVNATYDKADMLGHSYSGSSNLTFTTEICDNFLAVIEPAMPRDLINIVKFDANFTLGNIDTKPNEVLPLLNASRPTDISKTATFQLECNDTCEVDLHLSAKVALSTNKSYIVIGDTKSVSLYINLTNRAEPSYLTTVSVQSSENAAFRRTNSTTGVPAICNRTTITDGSYVTGVTCDNGNPLRHNQFSQFSLQFQVTERLLAPGVDYSAIAPFVHFDVHADSAGIELQEIDNKRSIDVPVRLLADVNIYGKPPEPEQVRYAVPHSKDSERSERITHAYEIHNKGPSFLPATSVIFKLPWVTPYKQTLIKDHNITPRIDEPHRCDFYLPSESYMTTAAPEIVTTEQQTNAEIHDATIEMPISVRRRRRSPDDEPGPTTEQQKIIRNMTCPDYECATIVCRLQRLSAGAVITVQFELEIQEKSLPVDKDVLYLRYGTEGRILPPDDPQKLFILWTHTKRDEVFTPFYPESPPIDSVDDWVIAVSVAGGLLLLLIIGLILCRIGFFRRQKRNQLQQQKRASGYYQMKQDSKKSRHSSTVSSKSTRSKEQGENSEAKVD